ncbi:hypothetical protein MOUN0_D02278 [Monosporozyma unispora]
MFLLLIGGSESLNGWYQLNISCLSIINLTAIDAAKAFQIVYVIVSSETQLISIVDEDVNISTFLLLN